MWHSKKRIEEKLSIGNLFPHLKQKAKRGITLAFGIGEALIVAIYGTLQSIGLGAIAYSAAYVIATAINVAIAAIASIAVSLVAGALQKTPSSGSISNNGRVFNTRAQSEPVRVVYGEARTGGNKVLR